jgi:hypothetical protein
MDSRPPLPRGQAPDGLGGRLCAGMTAARGRGDPAPTDGCFGEGQKVGRPGSRPRHDAAEADAVPALGRIGVDADGDVGPLGLGTLPARPSSVLAA